MNLFHSPFALPLFLSGICIFAFRQDRGPDPAKEPMEPYEQMLEGSTEFIKMMPVEGGIFLMGSADGPADEQPAHEVQVSNFWMSAYEITWDQYELFSEKHLNARNPEAGNEVDVDIDGVASATVPYVDMSHGMGKKGYPVVNITQYAALTFCKWLSAKTGLFYRLPTEAEWEYACRAGSTEVYSFGADSTQLADYAWYKANSGDTYHRVGQKTPNALGLYDMHGNVAEWTMDQYAEDTYASKGNELQTDPWEIPSRLYPRTVRGGSWQDNAFGLRSAARAGSTARWKRIDPQVPKSRWWFTNAPHVGFRIVRPKNTPSKEEIEKYWLQAIDEY